MHEFALAESLIEQHAFDKPLRTLDAVQLAVALGLKSLGLMDHFVAADARPVRGRRSGRTFRSKPGTFLNRPGLFV